MKKKCSQEHLTSPKGGVREPKPLKKVPPEEEERNWVDCAKVSLYLCFVRPIKVAHTLPLRGKVYKLRLVTLVSRSSCGAITPGG
jgi:hypothetical protein